MIEFAWPLALFSLAVIPAMVGLYVWLLRRRRRFAVSFGSLAVVKEAAPQQARWRRHLPFALLMLAMGSLVVAFARPRAPVIVPLSQTSIVLAMDVSRSMCSTDVAPNRLSIAQDAARAFVEGQPDDTQIGIVAFAGIAQIVVSPTTDTEQLTTAIDSFTTALGTTLGNATLKAIDAIAEINPSVAPSRIDLVDREALESGELETEEAVTEFVPDIVVLLTDGANTQGVDPLLAAEEAASRGVRVYTIGFGTEEPQQMVCSREQLAADPFENEFGGQSGFAGQRGDPNDGFDGFRQFLLLDEPTLESMAETTGGDYFRADSAEQLSQVFDDLPAQVELQTVDREISVFFLAVGALLTLVALVLSLRWNRFP